MQKKTLLAALALSPGSKAITEADEHQRLVVQEHWNDTEVWYNVSLIDVREGDVTHRTTVGGPDALQSWVYNCALDADIDPDGDIGDEKRWQCLEEMWQPFFAGSTDTEQLKEKIERYTDALIRTRKCPSDVAWKALSAMSGELRKKGISYIEKLFPQPPEDMQDPSLYTIHIMLRNEPWQIFNLATRQWQQWNI